MFRNLVNREFLEYKSVDPPKDYNRKRSSVYNNGQRDELITRVDQIRRELVQLPNQAVPGLPKVRLFNREEREDTRKRQQKNHLEELYEKYEESAKKKLQCEKKRAQLKETHKHELLEVVLRRLRGGEEASAPHLKYLARRKSTRCWTQK